MRGNHVCTASEMVGRRAVLLIDQGELYILHRADIDDPKRGPETVTMMVTPLGAEGDPRVIAKSFLAHEQVIWSRR